jgi:hypothetical protein
MSPAEKLSERILERLIEEKLISKSEAKKLVPKLAEGKLRPEDWRLAIEISMAQKKA